MSVAVVQAGGRPRAVWRRGILASRKGRWGFGILTLLALIALLAPWLAPHDPNAIDATRILAPPTLAHPFGSDALGRDVVENALAFFTVAWSMHTKGDRPHVMEAVCGLWSAQMSSSSCTAFAASLPTSIETASSGETVPASVLPS